MASTIKDVARRAGVSTATVSLVLSNRPGVRISDATRVRVREAAEELEFQPNIIARSLISGKSEMVGVIVNDITNPFITEVIRGVEHAAHERRHHVIVCEAEGTEVEMDTIRWLRSRGVDGIIMASGMMHIAAIADYLERERLPLVLINQDASGVAASVTPDHREVGRQAAELFIEAGYKRLGYLGHPASRANELRFAGFTEEAARHKQKVESVIEEAGRNPEAIVKSSRTLSAPLLERNCDAVFCFNDYLAYGFLDAARAAGKRVPEDVAVIGVDDATAARISTPGIATFSLNLMDAGRQAVDFLLTPEAAQPTLVAPKFVYRESAGKAGKD